MTRKEKCQRKLLRHIRSTYAMVSVEPAQGLFNFRCFNNAVQFALADSSGQTTVLECVVVDGGEPILHYINHRNGRLLETTLGYKAPQFEYYVIKEIHVDDYKGIHNEFNRSLEFWTGLYTTWFDRKVRRIDRLL